MSRQSDLPESVTRYIPCKCVRLRSEGNGVYRLYRYEAVKRKDGRWTSSSGVLIGKIVDGEGFFPNKRYLQEQKERAGEKPERFRDGISDVEYGSYALLESLSRDILEALQDCFPAGQAERIYTCALILCARGPVHPAFVEEFYEESFMAVQYAPYNFRMDGDSLTSLRKDLGREGSPARAFEKRFAGGVPAAASEEESCEERGADFLRLVAGLMEDRLERAVQGLREPGLSGAEVIRRASIMRMVRKGSVWELHNTRGRDIAQFLRMGFFPAERFTEPSAGRVPGG